MFIARYSLAMCKAVERVSMSMSEAMVLCWKLVDSHLIGEGQVSEISFFLTVAELTLGDRVRASDIQKRPGVEYLLFCLSKSQQRWLRYLMFIFRSGPTEGDPRADPEH